MKKTKILCTLGPASTDLLTIKRMHKAGMNAVRLNTAFGSLKEYRKVIRLVRSVSDIPVVVDIKGPEIRLKSRLKEVMVASNSLVKVGFRSSDALSFNRRIYGQIAPGDTILLNKGKVKARVASKASGYIQLQFKRECVLKDGGGVNVPGKRLVVPTLSDRDREIIRFAKRMKLEYIALSFTRNVDDVKALKNALRGSDAGVIAKIENSEGVENAEEILMSCDGVMIARGDLGIEVPSERIPLIQKGLINRCNQLGKISIVATEMLHTMIESPEPTRAETSDVANAILDGADVVMLSGETAVGKFPVEAVKTMTRIAIEVENHLPLKPLDEEVHDSISLAISKAVTSVIGTVEVDKIVVATRTGYTAMLISNFRVAKDIIAITDSEIVCRKLHLVYAIQPIVHPMFKNREKILEVARYCHHLGLVKRSDLVLFTAGLYTRKPTTNILQLHRISELLDYGRRIRRG